MRSAPGPRTTPAGGRRFVQEWAQERQEGVRRPAPRFLCWSGALCEALGGRVAYEPPLDELVPAGELVATLAGRTPLEGVNRSEWRGLTCYRFTRPQTLQELPELPKTFLHRPHPRKGLATRLGSKSQSLSPI